MNLLFKKSLNLKNRALYLKIQIRFRLANKFSKFLF